MKRGIGEVDQVEARPAFQSRDRARQQLDVALPYLAPFLLAREGP
jgi:hypothetical protein